MAAAVFLLYIGATLLQAASPGDEVVIVYNKRLPESKSIAEYYAERRHVPAGQIFGFNLSTNIEFSRAEFRDSLQKPLAKALEGAKLWHVATEAIPSTNNLPKQTETKVVNSKIRYAVLCYGVPYRILKEPDLKEPGTESWRPELRRNEAAVDSELARLPMLEQKLPLSGPLRNPLYLSTNGAALHPTNRVLMVARLDGPSASIARGLVDKAIQAEEEGLWGRAYFDLRNIMEPSYKIGDDWIRTASEVSRRLGFETTVDTNSTTFSASFPMSQVAFYMGWYDETASGPFTLPKVEFMPGAFAYHLHSFSGATLRSTNNNWVGPLLAKGATATMGCVDEPYLSGTPDLGIFAARFLYSGFSFGEAAYAAQSVLSWQTTVVGDPLYCPFGRNLDLLGIELAKNHSKLVEWYHLRVLDVNIANGKTLEEGVAYLEQVGMRKQSAVLTEKLADLYAGQGKPSSAIETYSQALKLDPSPQQGIRLRLTLGEKLVAANREADAYENYRELLSKCPDYTGKLEVYRRLLPLAQRLGKSQEAEEFQAKIHRLTLSPKS